MEIESLKLMNTLESLKSGHQSTLKNASPQPEKLNTTDEV